MYHVAICDDDRMFLQNLSAMTEEILQRLGIAHKITCYGTVAELYAALNKQNIQLILLDILMDNTDAGMQLAAWLRGQGNTVGIILISQSTDFILSGYDVQAIKYLVKPVEKKLLESAVQYDYQTRFQPKYLICKNACMEGILLSDIYYLETYGKKTAVYLNRDKIQYLSEKINRVQLLLPANSFTRCHQSFIINLNHTSRVMRYTAQLTDGREVPISKRFYKEIQSSFLLNLETRR